MMQLAVQVSMIAARAAQDLPVDRRSGEPVVQHNSAVDRLATWLVIWHLIALLVRLTGRCRVETRHRPSPPAMKGQMTNG
jgi:hypothetical protein